MRTQLRRLGFAPLFDAVWVCPYHRADRAERALGQLGVGTYTVFRQAGAGAGTDPLAAFDLDPVRERYERLIERLEAAEERMTAADLPPEEALIIRTELMDRWRQAPRWDPSLPPALLDDDWPGFRARQLFNRVYDTLGPLAVTRVREIVEPFSQSVARRATYHPMLPN
ncbi:MAG: PaaX family transcriptional regulator C-terminal domain-containing protein [Ilumatobacteraceae bacterium]